MLNLYDYRERIKDSLMVKLYDAQLIYWNRKLIVLASKNTDCHGRTGVYKIHYKGRNWDHQTMNFGERGHSNLFLRLHPDFPELEKEMEVIANEFEDLRDERYESERFLSGLVILPIPPHVFKDILGGTLYDVCSSYIERLAEYTSIKWDTNTRVTVHTYCDSNKDILQTMNKRLIANLIEL